LSHGGTGPVAFWLGFLRKAQGPPKNCAFGGFKVLARGLFMAKQGGRALGFFSKKGGREEGSPRPGGKNKTTQPRRGPHWWKGGWPHS